jgi:hypothetical protein
MNYDLAYLSVNIDSLTASVNVLEEKKETLDEQKRTRDLENDNLMAELKDKDEAFVKRLFASIQRDKPPRIQEQVDKYKRQVEDNNKQHGKLTSEIDKQT